MKYSLTKPQDISRMCFVCGEENPLSLHAKFYETDEGELVGIFETGEQHQSYPGRVHGGVSAAILDEIIGRSAMIIDPDMWGVTVELTTKYRRPVPYGRPITARGRITREQSRMFEGTGEIVLDDGTVAVEAKGRYLKLPLESINQSDDNDVAEEMRADTRPMPRTLEIGSCR
ncbi:MAG: PaaI family thioesterase [Coriobacteriia bacterium]|nr:PaaI family thioesterase [Coriobacteriia bacterium]